MRISRFNFLAKAAKDFVIWAFLSGVFTDFFCIDIP
jgi:hypothetical protein